jgi:peptide/nickel transport system permease protein
MWGVPPYWIAEILIFVLAVRLHLFPPSLTSGVATSNLLVAIPAILGHSFLPILTLVLYAFPIQAMVMRNNMINVLKEDFISATVARGIKPRTLILGHAARNALLPSITNLALSFGALLSGAYIIEIVYSYPGMGYLITQSIYNHDFPVLQGVFFFSAALVIIANLLGDVAIVLLDPRIDYEMARA